MTHIIVTSDLHLGITTSHAIRDLVEAIAARKADAVVVAGDIGERLDGFVRCLDLLKPLTCPVGILAGNHDLWLTRSSTVDSEQLFKEVLPQAVREHGMTWLEEDSLIFPDGVAVAGSIGWYDYSRRQPSTAHLSAEQFAAAKPARNNDGNRMHWRYTDPEFAELVGTGLVQRLRDLEANPSVREVLVATHVPAFDQQLVAAPGDDPIADAYFGNLTLGRKLLPFAKVTTVVSGHTHRTVQPMPIRNGERELTVATVGSDYSAPRFMEFYL